MLSRNKEGIPDGLLIREGIVTGYSGKGARIKIPDGVRAIGDRAFSGCVGLRLVELPESVIQIGEDAFAGCEDLACVICHTPATAAMLQVPAYLGGGPGDLPEEVREAASIGFMRAIDQGIDAVEPFAKEYLAYIREHTEVFYPLAASDRSVLLYLIREGLLPREETENLLQQYLDKYDTRACAFLLDYRHASGWAENDLNFSDKNDSWDLSL